ncbi:MAG: transporter, partial [Actinomycetales bacterium]
MSSALYALGRWCFNHGRRVTLIWVLILAIFGGLSVAFMGNFDDKFTIPSAASQDALNKLRMTFPQASGLSALAIIVPPEGSDIDSPAIKATIERGVTAFEEISIVEGAVSPWNKHIKGLVAEDGRAAIIQVRLEMRQMKPEELTPLIDTAQWLEDQLPAGSTVTMGGEAFSMEFPKLSIVEVIGVGVAMVVLAIVLGSLVAAGMPIITAIIGVGVTMAVMMLLANIMTVNSVTPMLAVMLGLAVGIDYALFILSRHRDQLLDPQLDTEESTARAVATAGSAVVFAGLTVVIALLGLGLAGIPFLTVMGAFASLGVSLAVTIALTLLPAFMGLAGEKLRPKKVF